MANQILEIWKLQKTAIFFINIVYKCRDKKDLQTKSKKVSNVLCLVKNN